MNARQEPDDEFWKSRKTEIKQLSVKASKMEKSPAGASNGKRKKVETRGKGKLMNSSGPSRRPMDKSSRSREGKVFKKWREKSSCRIREVDVRGAKLWEK